MSQLEIIDILCDVTGKMSRLIDDMSIQLARVNVEREVLEELQNRQKECNKDLDIAEYKLRRQRHDGH